MSEEQFVEAFEMLRDRTRGWSEFPPEVIMEDSTRLFVLRCVLGLTQKELSEKLDVHKSTIKSLESGRRHIIHRGPAKRWTSKIDALLASQKIDFDVTLAKFKEFKRFRHDDKFVTTDKPLTKLTEKELEEMFDIVERKTSGFTKFPPDILMGMPQSLTIFRLGMSLSHDKFSKLLDMDERAVRTLSSGKSSLGLERASKLSVQLMKMIKTDDMTFDKVLRSFRAFSRFLHLDIETSVAKGLFLARLQPLTPFEKIVSSIFLEAGIKFETHAEVDCIRKVLSVDFALPDPIDPKIIIEVFSSSRKSVGKSLLRIREIDHRFRMIKLAKPKIKTILCIDFKCPITLDLAHKFIELELLDCDALLICDEVQELPKLIRKMSHPSSEPSAFLS